jgi:hypothetical protein
MKFFLSTILTLFSLLVLAQPIIGSNVYASCDTVTDPSCVNISTLPTTPANSNTIATISNIVFSLIGAIAVLMIILAGFKYITSTGKPEELARAKDTIIYSAVGIVVCVSAVTIVSFVAGFIK